MKARKAVKENRSQVPVISESIYKILETIGQVNQDCSIEIQKTEVNSNEVSIIYTGHWCHSLSQ